MSRLSPKSDVLRALFLRSGNQCAFPGCIAPLTNERNQFIAQVCHIESAEEGGERFNLNQTDEQRRQYSNLLILCYPHHIETNDVSLYTVERLQRMKAEHESNQGKNLFKIDESLLYKIALEMNQYWSRVEALHKAHRMGSGLAIEIDAKAGFLDLTEKARSLISDLLDLRNMLIESDDALISELIAFTSKLEVPESQLEWGREQIQKFQARNWEPLNLGITNTITELQVTLSQMEIRYLEEFLKLNPNDLQVQLRMKNLKEEFEAIVVSVGYVD